MTKTLIPPDLADEDFLKRNKSVCAELFLHSLQQERLNALDACRKSGINLDFVSEIYSDEGHFVYELLQNAEDAGARTVSFHLADDALTVTHDGKLFSRRNVWSITGVGNSDKNKLNAIGKFGLGFKSVFAVCDRPEIYSGEFRFAIKNSFVPHPLPQPQSSLAAYADGGKTVIHLPLKEDGGNYLREKIKQTLGGLGATVLLFLQNIRRLEWQFGQDGEKHYYEKSGNLQRCDNNNISAGRVEFCGESTESYFLLRRKEKIGGKSVNVEVAYQTDSEGEIISITPPPPLSVYFPLEKENPGLSFRLHIPYKTTPSRETCGFDDAENKKLTESAAVLVADTLPILRDRGKLSANVVSGVFPWIPVADYHAAYQVQHAVVKAVKGKFLSDKLLLTACDNYATAGEVVATDEYLPDIINADFVGNFDKGEYANRKLWLGKISTQVRNALKIPSYDIEDFLRDADNDVLSQLADEQMVIFYRKLRIYYEQKTKWQGGRHTKNNIDAHEIRKRTEKSCMRNYPIVRLQEPHDGKGHISATDARLPKDGGDSVVPTVARTFLEDDEAAYFLREVLSIKEPDDIDEVGKIVKNNLYANDEVVWDAHNEKMHIAGMRKILQVAADTDEVNVSVAGKPIVKTASGIPAFATFDNSFLECEDLRCVFAGYSGMYFVDASFYDKAFGDDEFAENGGWRGLFKKLDTKDTFVIGADSGSLEKLRHALRSIADSNDNSVLNRSVALWRFLIHSIPGLYDYQRVSLRQTLAPFSWLCNKNEIRITAEEIGEYALENIHPRYKEEAELANADIAALSKTVGLKFDDIEDLQRRVKQRDEQIKQRDDKLEEVNAKLEVANQIIARLEAKSVSGDSDTRGNDSDNLVGNKGRNMPPKKLVIRDYQWSPKVRISGSVSGGGNRGGGDAEESKEIGDVGEAELCEWLRKEYPDAEVVNENDNTPNNPGYDILVTHEGVTKYYECKSFTSATPPRRVRMTRAQMEMAQDKGEHYFLCVIYDINADIVQMLSPIVNPAALDKQAVEWGVDITGYRQESSAD